MGNNFPERAVILINLVKKADKAFQEGVKKADEALEGSSRIWFNDYKSKLQKQVKFNQAKKDYRIFTKKSVCQKL